MDQDRPRTSDDRSPRLRAASPLANRMSRLLAQALAEAIAPLGLAPAQFAVLRELWKVDGLTQSQLTQNVEVEQATMAKTLKRMERDGLITRAPHPADSRASIIRLTDQARQLETAATAAAKKVNARAFAGLSRKEQKRFVDMTHRVITALKEERPEPSGASSPPL